MFASDADYVSFVLADGGIVLWDGGDKQHKVSHLAVGLGIAREKGFFWDRLAIHLENGDIIRIGGIGKKQSSQLQKELNRAFRAYLRDFYQSLVPQIQDAVKQTELLLSSDRYVRQGAAKQWLRTHEGLAYAVKRKDIHQFLSAELRQQLQTIDPLLNEGYKAIESINNAYIDRQLRKFQRFFDSVDSKPLTANQRRACVIDEQHNLILAGAGTGKTSTMIGRAGYLIESGLAQPQQILMLAFARKAAEEMDGRIKAKLGIDTLTVKTFHSLGKHIISQVEGIVPAINPLAEDDHLRARFVDEQLQRLLQDKLYNSRFITYFVRFRHPYKSAFQFKSLGEYNNYILEQEICVYRIAPGKRNF